MSWSMQKCRHYLTNLQVPLENIFVVTADQSATLAKLPEFSLHENGAMMRSSIDIEALNSYEKVTNFLSGNLATADNRRFTPSAADNVTILWDDHGTNYGRLVIGTHAINSKEFGTFLQQLKHVQRLFLQFTTCLSDITAADIIQVAPPNTVIVSFGDTLIYGTRQDTFLLDVKRSRLPNVTLAIFSQICTHPTATVEHFFTNLVGTKYEVLDPATQRAPNTSKCRVWNPTSKPLGTILSLYGWNGTHVRYACFLRFIMKYDWSD